MVRDRSSLTPAERRARRDRVRRRREWAQATQTGSVLTLKAHDVSIRLHDGEGTVPAHWRSGKPYERPLLEHIHSCGFEGLAVDAGANIGNHTIWLAVVCGLEVAAFEPIKCLELDANLALNDLAGRATVHQVALGDDDTTALHVGKGRLDTGKGTLPVRTLDSFDLQGVSVIKADVEGMEAAVFRGGEETIRRDRPVIFAEEWGQPEHDAIAAVLEPWGYTMTNRFHGKGSATPVGRWDPT